MSTESTPLLRELADSELPKLLDQLERMAANSNVAPNEEEKQRSICAIRQLREASESEQPRPAWMRWFSWLRR